MLLDPPEFDLPALRNARLDHLRRHLERADIELAVLTNPVSIRYATDYRGYAGFQSRIPSQYLLVPVEGPVVLHGACTDALDTIDRCETAHSVTAFDGGTDLRTPARRFLTTWTSSSPSSAWAMSRPSGSNAQHRPGSMRCRPRPADRRRRTCHFIANRYACVFHGVGLSDEYPKIPYRQDWEWTGYDGELEAGTVLSVESYVGAEGGAEGVKIEQIVQVTADGTIPLSTFPIDL